MMFDYKAYWEKRYLEGGNSGKGSYGENALFKAAVINRIFAENGYKTALEVGCGDGHNLGLYDIHGYLGVDVSKSAIESCKEKYKDDEHKEFMDAEELFRQEDIAFMDVTLCLDVTYHIFPREEWTRIIDFVIKSAGHMAIFYSFLNPTGHANHINDYNFLEYIQSLGARYEILDDVPPDSQSRFLIVYKDE